MATEICQVTKANLNALKNLEIDPEEVEQKALKLSSDTLRVVYLQGKKISEFSRAVLKGIHKVMVDRAKTREPNKKGDYELELEDGEKIKVSPRIQTILNEGVARAILHEKNLLDECSKMVFDIDKIKALHKVNAITDEEYNAMIIQGEPTYTVRMR